MSTFQSCFKICLLLLCIASYIWVIQRVFEQQSFIPTEKSGLLLDVGMKPCSNKSQWALIVVMSAPHHVTIRKTIRKTWGQDMFLDQRISLVFFLGLSPLDFVDDIVLEENKFTQDIVRVDVLDVPQNETLMEAKFLAWTKKSCRFCTWILRINDIVETDKALIEKTLSNTNDTPNMIYCVIREKVVPQKEDLNGSKNTWSLTKTVGEIRFRCKNQTLLFSLPTIRQLIKHQHHEKWVKNNLKFEELRGSVNLKQGTS